MLREPIRTYHTTDHGEEINEEMKFPFPLALSALAALAPLAWATPAIAAHSKGLEQPPYRTGLSDLDPQVQFCASYFLCKTDEECSKLEDCRVKAHYDPTRIFCGYLFYYYQCVVRGSPDPYASTRFDKAAAGLSAPTSTAVAAASAHNFAPTAASQM
ncbi:hypothetical protein RJZ56_002178 [Blastomyces dermatitidis]|uniref:Uncharacterized protein n=3 Tax=Blastomyces TaxID=229219 RepID=A0A179UKK0_BLAGS|nr:uncharacterized protein BDBG_03793 [Blastomyces gilchristii SLH14081]XP_031577937.1 hypothetical protein, variant 1 [Blastomyces gilchristii SLH14081]XP_045274403.1 uncharacterized protein BDCG_02100 [Blastomyces dermatitidis ER-3]EGE79770.1 hypothetical protein BDDG_02711 [Blastomyces dermatitidis ATCC 18188]EEQ86980.1 hypothetical protein BDCG_02100 [Blastomyces dermatitidis ER-3]OAT07758.1 hypothetical protein BDBG_03793 [Blastomyces gilchristii SLH14081]OAT07759.1 hypothetical protein,